MDARRLLTTNDLEERFGLSPRQQHRLRRSGQLPYLKFGPSRGSRVFYELRDVEAFLAAHRHGAKG